VSLHCALWYCSFCFVDGLLLQPAVRVLRRGVSLSARNAASLSNVDRNLSAAVAAITPIESDAVPGIC